MLNYKVGCLTQAFLKNEVWNIGHQANCFCTMKSGVAKTIAEVFPEAVRADNKTEKGDIKKLGGITSTVCQKYKRETLGWVFNIYGQYDYGTDSQKTNYKSLELGLQRVCDFLLEERPKERSLGLPKLGAGLAGGNWDIISKIIEKELVEKGIPVVIYVLNESEIP